MEIKNQENKEKYGYIYLTTNLINGKKYIGQKKSNKFINRYKGSGTAIKKAIDKYGIKNFRVELLEWCYSKEELSEKEQYWISYYNAVKDSNFYNMSIGGSSGRLGIKESPDIILKKSKKVQILETGEVYLSLTDAAIKLTGNEKNSPTIGNAARATHKNKFSTYLGYHWVFLKYHDDLPYTEEERNNILNNLPLYYETNMHSVQCLETGEIFHSRAEAAIKYNCSGCDISRSASATKNNKNFTCKKLHWIDLDNNIPYSLKECKEILDKLLLKNIYKIQSLETGEVFNSVVEIGKKYDGKYTNVYKGIKNTSLGKSSTSLGQHWIRLENNIPYDEEERKNILESLK